LQASKFVVNLVHAVAAHDDIELGPLGNSFGAKVGRCFWKLAQQPEHGEEGSGDHEDREDHE